MSVYTIRDGGNTKIITNSEALLCFLYCVKILLKTKSHNNYSDSINSLCEIMKVGGPENCILFYK